MSAISHELRIGNRVLVKPSYSEYDFEECYITPNHIKEIDNGELLCESIILTEEWLIKFGFKPEPQSPSVLHSRYFSMCICDYKYSFSYAEFREDWGFYHSYTDAMTEEENNRFDCVSFGIKYVHQLQNLMFALTQEELQLNKTEKL